MLVRVLFGSKSGYGLGGLPVNLRTHLDRNSKLIGQIDVGTVSVCANLNKFGYSTTRIGNIWYMEPGPDRNRLFRTVQTCLVSQ